ncbi:hypothetical protein M2454_000653 [Aequitasia blattaphilus]|uniref:DUF4340 domain-containing protein n=1 Tax=Aequitasia blattaphilus TaxID=2949332 RepID=A0ABT1ECA0_9FIRM|nr:hypothetical protein [Aequitasia blattaphilus]MCP1102127.1 hypothetical protein [Aequitasia blattaphilus]MCR8614767.1 hypothetical protein [Aequitasia blattaphilus]
MKRTGLIGIILMTMVIVAGCQKEEVPELKQETEKEEAVENELIQEENPDFIPEGIRRTKVVREGEDILEISYEPKEYESSYEYWKVRIPYGSQAVLDTEAALSFYQNFAELDFSNGQKATAAQKNSVENSQTSFTLEFCQADPENERASYQASADRKLILHIGETDENGDYYTALETDFDRIYLMKKDVIESILNVKPFDLILKISGVCPVDTVDKVMVTVDGKEQELKKEEYQEIYTDLFDVLIVKEMEVKKDNGKELLQLTFLRNVEEAEDLTITYYDYDDQYASVKVNGEEHFLVKKEDVEKLIQIIESR